MRKEKALITLLRGVVELLAEESASNPEFAKKIEILLLELPDRLVTHKKPITENPVIDLNLPDIHAEWNSRGEIEFKLWLKDQPLNILRALIRSQDLDPTHRTSKWKEPEKLAAYLAEGLRARLARGSAFIGQHSKSKQETLM